MLYPLKFEPILKKRLWGGNQLQTRFNKKATTLTVGESWEVSGVEGSVSVVSEGALKGISLQYLVDNYPVELMGNRLHKLFGNEFPVLIKFIDAKDDLSIQVHPNDELAQRLHNTKGKTEMWVIMHHEQGAELIIGFKKPISPKEFQNHLNNGTLTDVLHYEKVATGDSFFIPTGTIHAIGKGILLAEIQQTSDVTYRVFDFNRKDENGNLRELHIQNALEAINFQQGNSFKQLYEKVPNKPNKIVSCPYFTTNFIKLKESSKQAFTTIDSFRIYLCLKGSGYFEVKNSKYSIKMGESILIPACIKEINFLGEETELLEVYV